MSATLTVDRGERSMGALYAMYGVTTVVFSLIVQVAGVLIGRKAALIFTDYVLLSYLFFFNSWFRNRIVFQIFQRVSRD